MLKHLICSMCDFPEDVRIDAHVTQYSASFDVYLHSDDVSKVLGAGGAHATALRVIFSAVYGRLGKKLHLLIVNPKWKG